MIKDDVKKIYKLEEKLKKTEVDEKEKIQSQINKIERSLLKQEVNHDGLRAFYTDVYENKVVLFDDGTVIQFQGTSINPKFTSFLFAFLILLGIYAIVLVVHFTTGKLSNVFNAFDVIVNPLSLALSLATIYNCREMLFQRKHWKLLLALILVSVFNLTVSVWKIFL